MCYLILLVSFLFVSPSFAMHQEDTLFFSKLDEKMLEEEGESQEWVLFVKQIHNAQYTIMFPKQPQSINENVYQVEDQDKKYRLSIESSTKEEFAEKYKDEKCFETEYGTACEIKEKKKKQRILFYPEKKLLFTFETEGQGDHEQFVNSFEIVLPLP